MGNRRGICIFMSSLYHLNSTLSFMAFSGQYKPNASTSDEEEHRIAASFEDLDADTPQNLAGGEMPKANYPKRPSAVERRGH